MKFIIPDNGEVKDVYKRQGGYILMASQGFEGDVPIENIEAVYSVDRSC